ncbi:RbsD/FucU family protein [[Clostridium] hylemonae]|uniref:RbsD/FucU family protein n=1 Tax=[Clostridium] hylemonae TaxID=89153 RepID=UPI001106F466|nr:RbsD/FucU domain-containing protein [[Clostridium] hylemonae]
MLKGIPKIISPELLKVLSEMGHGDRIVIADGNFPAASVGKNGIVIRCDGHTVPEILDAVLKLFPLDASSDKPVSLMKVPEGEDVKTPIWDIYKVIIGKHEERGDSVVENIEKQEFMKMAGEAYAVIATGEGALYANVMLKKGVVQG